MKTILFTAALFLLSIQSAVSQERPTRNFDNFDSPRGVQVLYPPSPSNAYKRTGAAPNTSDQRVAENTAPRDDRRYVKKTAMVSMTVYDGYAQRESVNAPRANVSTQREISYARPREAPVQYAPGPVAMTAAKSLKGYSTGDSAIDSYIVDSSRRYNIDPLLIYSQMNQESSFKVRATSNKGASGLMQLMPATARRMGVTDIYDPRQNIDGGVKYMRLLMDMFNGDVNLALAGYNAGEGAVMKYGNQIPPYKETQDYVRRISSRYQNISNAATTAYDRPARTNRSGAGASTSTTYDPDPVTTRLADGRPRLVNK